MTSDARKLGALVKLGAARQSPLDEVGQQVYLEGTQQIPSDVFERACQELAAEPRNDFEPMFPPLGVVIQRCREVRAHWDSLSAPRQLREARPEPMSKDEARAWITRLKSDVARKVSEKKSDPSLPRSFERSWYEREPGSYDT